MTEEQIRGTKNLGLIQAIHAGTSPPLNTKIIWYDDNLGQKIHKYYKVEISQWVPFGGAIVNVSNSTTNGNLSFRWGNKETDPHFRIVMMDDDVRIEDIPLRVHNLILDIPYWDEIKNYEPMLLIDRYKRKEKKGRKKGVSEPWKRFRKSGFSHEKFEAAELNNRISEILISEKTTFLNFRQENYFGYSAGKSYAKGMGAKRKGNSNHDFQEANETQENSELPGAYVYLSFRLKLKISDSETITTGSLGIVKMYISSRNKLVYKIQ